MFFKVTNYYWILKLHSLLHTNQISFIHWVNSNNNSPTLFVFLHILHRFRCKLTFFSHKLTSHFLKKWSWKFEIFVRSQINRRRCRFVKAAELLQAIRVRAKCHSYSSIPAIASSPRRLPPSVKENIAPFQSGYLLCSRITTIKRCYLVSWKRLSIEMFAWNFIL